MKVKSKNSWVNGSIGSIWTGTPVAIINFSWIFQEFTRDVATITCWLLRGMSSPHKLATWWHHQMETFAALLAPCEGNPPVTGGFPSQRPVTRSFSVSLTKASDAELWCFLWSAPERLSKQSRRWWFVTASRSLWHHCNDSLVTPYSPSDYRQYWFW